MVPACCTIVRWASLLVVGCGLFIAYALPNVVASLEIFWKVASMMGVAFWLGLFWRRYTVAGASASTLAAFGCGWLSSQAWFAESISGMSIVASLGVVTKTGTVVAVLLP